MSTDHLLPLRLSWPKSSAVTTLCHQRKAELERACDLLKTRVPECRCATVDKLSREVAMSLANGFLSTVVDQEGAVPADLDQFLAKVPALANEAWLSDVFFAAGCIKDDEAANRSLIKLIDDDVAPKIEHQFGSNPLVVDEVISNLSSHLRLTTKEGFNRGRPRLAQFYGRSTLKTWIRTVAVNMGFDLASKVENRPISGSEEGIIDDAPAPPTDPAMVPDGRLVVELEESLQRAFGKLLESLADQKKRQPGFKQYDYAILCLVEGRSAREVAELLGVTQSRITELAHTVYKKLVDLLVHDDPRWERLNEADDDDPAGSNKRRAVSTEHRQLLVKWLQKLLGAQEGVDREPTAGPDDE